MTDVMPKSLCPYFWKTVLATILVLPVLIFSAPAYLVDNARNEETDSSHSDRVLLGLVCYAAIAFLFCFLCFAGWCVGLLPAKGSWDIIIFIGAVVTVMAVFAVIAYLREEHEDKINIKYYAGEIDYEERQRLIRAWMVFGLKVPHFKDWLLVKYFIAWTKRQCPIIDWHKKYN